MAAAAIRHVAPPVQNVQSGGPGVWMLQCDDAPAHGGAQPLSKIASQTESTDAAMITATRISAYLSRGRSEIRSGFDRGKLRGARLARLRLLVVSVAVGRRALLRSER